MTDKEIINSLKRRIVWLEGENERLRTIAGEAATRGLESFELEMKQRDSLKDTIREVLCEFEHILSKPAPARDKSKRRR